MKTKNHGSRIPKPNRIVKGITFICITITLCSCGSLTSLSTDSRIKAVNRTLDQAKLIKVALEDIDWSVRKAAFVRLKDQSLLKIEGLTKDPAVVLATKIRSGQTTWTDAFADASRSNKSLGDVVGAAALVERPSPSSFDVVAACHKYIRQGDASRIPELRTLLDRFGNISLAEDYLNCGNNELYRAGADWGRANGYDVGTGYGSHRVQWGEEK
jgi:hypothetical protein